MSYKIALTSSNNSAIDLHFGHAEEFYVLEVNENSGGWELLERRSLRPEGSPSCPPGASSCDGCGHGHQDGRLQVVAGILSDCVYILTARIGPKPQAVLKQAGITALESPPDISQAVQQLNAYHQRLGKKREVPATGRFTGGFAAARPLVDNIPY
jgi:predicted Fe-Mo cluster-binding NifX family protein